MTKHPLSDLDADIRDHIERETKDNMERGMAAEEARFAALKKFGNVTLVREETRVVWIPRGLDGQAQGCGAYLRAAGPRAALEETRGTGSGLHVISQGLLNK